MAHPEHPGGCARPAFQKSGQTGPRPSPAHSHRAGSWLLETWGPSRQLLRDTGCPETKREPTCHTGAAAQSGSCTLTPARPHPGAWRHWAAFSQHNWTVTRLGFRMTMPGLTVISSYKRPWTVNQKAINPGKPGRCHRPAPGFRGLHCLHPKWSRSSLHNGPPVPTDLLSPLPEPPLSGAGCFPANPLTGGQGGGGRGLGLGRAGRGGAQATRAPHA